jgi:hypothetical protein
MDKVLEKMVVTSCCDCPFYTNDSDNGESCYQGEDLSWRAGKDSTITFRHTGIVTTLPKKCPLFTTTFTIELSDTFTLPKPNTNE